jgi:TolA-binding protein
MVLPCVGATIQRKEASNVTRIYYHRIIFAATMLAVGAAAAQGREKPVSAEIEVARFRAAERLYQQKRYPHAADAYCRLLDTPAGRFRKQAIYRLYEIANYFLQDTWNQVRQSQDFQQQDWMLWLYPCDVFSEILPNTRTIVRWTLSCRDFLHTDQTKPFFNEAGRAIQLLRRVHDSDPAGPLADKTLYLMGYVAWFREDYPRADEAFSRLEKKHPASPYTPYAVELAIKAKLMCVDGTDDDKRRVAEAHRLINKALNQPACSKLVKQDLMQLLVSVRAHEANSAFEEAEKCQLAGQMEQARTRYQRILEDFPGTYTASEAKQRLKILQSK